MEVDDECVQHPAIYVEVEYRSGHEVPAPKSELGHAGPAGNADPLARDTLVCTVKVECPQGHVSTETRSLSTKIGALKTHLAQLVDLSPDALTLSFQNQPLTDDQTLDHFAKPHDSINFTLTSKDPSMHPIRINPSGHLLLPVPDVITVRVKDKYGRSKDLVIEIENRCSRLPFLGGWRWKHSGLEVYHASTQTDITAVHKIRMVQPSDLNMQDIQVATISHKETQTGVGVSCQVRPFEWMNTSSADCEIKSGRFVTAEEANDAAIVLQRNFRSWMVEKKTANQKDEEDNTSKADDQVIELSEPEHPEGIPVESKASVLQPMDSFISHMEGSVTTPKNFPGVRTPTDASVSVQQKLDMKIFHDLEQLNSMRSSASKDRLMQRLLHKVTQPKLWRSATGETIQVETAEIEQLRDTRHVYEAICNSTLTEERVRALHLLKRTLAKESGTTVKEILQLVDRELNLLARGMMSSTLSGLQSRLRALMRRYIQSKLPQEMP